ncbi:hypothetical protein BBS798_3369 [Bordetella bronchiseptica]|nr:hypothetical protein BBS798_3369 [Bordetella bronchiseptica]
MSGHPIPRTTMSMPTLNRQQRRQLEQQRSRQRAQRRVERPAHPPMLIKAQQTLAPLEAIIDQIERAGTVDTDRQGRPIFHCAADGQWYESAPQAPAGWRWTLHPAGLHPDVYAAAAAHTSDEARNAALEEAAGALEDHRRAGREWVPGSLWDALSREAAARIRALKSTPAPTAAEGGEDDMLTIAYLAGAQAEKERAALSAQPGAIRNPLIAEPSGNPGELDCAALSARKEGDARASATQAEQGERDAG